MRLRLAFFYSFGQVGGQLILKFLANIVLARLLLPEEIGVFAVAFAMVLILNSLRDFGVNRYLIKEIELTEVKLATVYTLAVGIGWSIAAVVFLGRNRIAEFYDEPALAGIFAVLSVAFLLNPLGQPTLALMRRELQYKQLSLIVLAASLSGAVVAILTAMRGVGPVALAYGVVIEATLMCLAALACRPRIFLMRPTLTEWRSVLGFGGQATTMAVISNLGMQAPELVMGRVIGFAEVGLFFRGQALSRLSASLVQNSTNWVLGAEIGALHRSGSALRKMVLRSMEYTLVISWPMLIFLGFKAEAIVNTLYGENWLPAAAILQVLVLATGLSMITAMSTAVYEGTGAIGLHLKNECIIQASSILLLFLGLRYGLEGVIWSRVASAVIIVLVHSTVLRRYAQIGFGDIVSVIRRQLLITVGFALALGGLVWLEPDGMALNPWILLGELALMAVVFVVLLFLSPHPLRQEVQNIALIAARWVRLAAPIK